MILVSCLIRIHLVSMFTVLSVIWYDLNDNFSLPKRCSWLELIILLLVLVVRSFFSLYVLDIVPKKISLCHQQCKDIAGYF